LLSKKILTKNDLDASEKSLKKTKEQEQIYSFTEMVPFLCISLTPRCIVKHAFENYLLPCMFWAKKKQLTFQKHKLKYENVFFLIFKNLHECMYAFDIGFSGKNCRINSQEHSLKQKIIKNNFCLTD